MSLLEAISSLISVSDDTFCTMTQLSTTKVTFTKIF